MHVYLHSQLQRGSLAQLVQSICLTSRGSGVRIPQLPHLKVKHHRLTFFYALQAAGRRATEAATRSLNSPLAPISESAA